jgi:4-amino-4-deoxy-L-arabinose transferase-like glycosyltransferase
MAALMAKALPPGGTALLLGLTAALLLLRLGSVPLVGPDEPRYVRVAVEMHRAHEWVRPTLAGAPWLEKPPLYYWLAGLCFSVFGETEWAARLPSVLATLVLVGATALFGARLHDGSAGLHAGFVLATSILPFAYGHAATMDMLLAATLTVGLGLLALRLLGIAGPLAIPVGAAFLGLATLAKGPLGVLLPGLVVLAYLIAAREWRFLRELLSPAAIAAFLIVAAPWYVLILLDQGHAFVDVFLLNHNLQRFTSTIHRHPGPPYYYVPLVLAGLFPWTGLVLPGLAALAPRRSRSDRFVLVWLLIPFVFFSLAGSKLPGYVLPCLPPLAILMGRAAALLVEGRGPDAKWASPRATALLGLAVGAFLACTPALLWRMGEPGWRLALPFGLWSVLVAFLFARRVMAAPAAALQLLRVGGAGLLLLFTMAAPPILARRESGRELFLPARGRDVLVFGAWRTAWMAGYFYNDGKVQEVGDVGEVLEAAAREPVLVLAGPGEARRLENLPSVTTLRLAEDYRGDALLRVALR